MKFNRGLIDDARREFFRVYVDVITPEEIKGSTTAYTGDRVRIYPTGWTYEEPETFTSNETLTEYMNEFWNDLEDCTGLTRAELRERR